MEDVVVHRALPGQNPGPGERGGGWDTNKVSGRNDNTPHVVIFFPLPTKNLKGTVHPRVKLRSLYSAPCQWKVEGGFLNHKTILELLEICFKITGQDQLQQSFLCFV